MTNKDLVELYRDLLDVEKLSEQLSKDNYEETANRLLSLSRAAMAHMEQRKPDIFQMVCDFPFE